MLNLDNGNGPRASFSTATESWLACGMWGKLMAKQ